MKTYHVGVSGWAQAVVQANSGEEAEGKVDRYLDGSATEKDEADIDPQGIGSLYDWVVEDVVEIGVVEP